MSLIELSWFMAGGVFLLFLVSHLLHLRLAKPPDRSKVINAWFRAYLILGIVLFFVLSNRLLPESSEPLQNSSSDVVLQTLTFSLLGLFAVLAIYGLVDHSIRVRVAMELARQQLTRSELVEKYEPAKSMLNRLDKLVAGNYLELRDGRYHLTPKGLWFSKLVRAAKSFYGPGPGG